MASTTTAPAPAKKSTNQYRATIGGALGGLCEALCLHPMDTVKTRLQLSGAGGSGMPKYNGMVHCFREIVKTEGFLALYKGLTPFTVHLMSKYSLRFFSFTGFQSAMKDSSGKTKPWQNFLSGMSAGILEAIFIVTPFEVVKIRLQSQLGLQKEQLVYRGPIDAAIKIVKQEGITALWKGLTPTMFRNASNQSCNFMSYNLIKQHLWETNDLAPWQTILTGALAGGIGPMLNGPADVIKTRLMQQKTVPGQPLKYQGFIHAFKTILAEEGVLALYKGLLPRLMRLAPGQAITWTVVEQVNQAFTRFESK